MHTTFKVIKVRDMSYLVNSISNEKVRWSLTKIYLFVYELLATSL